jgi:hypothetical protein
VRRDAEASSQTERRVSYFTAAQNSRFNRAGRLDGDRAPIRPSAVRGDSSADKRGDRSPSRIFGLRRRGTALSDALERVETIKKAAASLLDLLCPREQSDAAFQADRLIKKQLRAFTGDADGFARIADTVSCLIAACSKSTAGLKATDGLKSDKHWQLWVRRVRCIVKLHDLPAGVRHDRNRSKNWRPSAFTVLIRTIQQYLPAYAARFAATDEGFSQALNRALSGQ